MREGMVDGGATGVPVVNIVTMRGHESLDLSGSREGTFGQVEVESN